MLPMLVLLWSTVTLAPAAPLSTCTFEAAAAAARWSGSCGRIFDEEPRMQLARAASITTGTWREGVVPADVWSGDMTDPDTPKAPIELEIYPGGTGVLRTVYGWFPVSGYAASASTLRFQIDPQHEVPPTELDRRIVQRADAMLPSTEVWNRADNRKCPPSATTWSIYCAVARATIEVTGGFHHRRPAMELVRQVIEERTAGRHYHHRMMDYNNDRSTKLEDAHSVFAEALARMDRAQR